MGALRLFFCCCGSGLEPLFFLEVTMKKRPARALAHAAVLAALYVVLTWLQNMIFPNSASAAVQFRVAEALCIFALFTPAAISGLTVGCILANLCTAGVLPLDIVIGSLATLLATGSMWLLRNRTMKGYPLFSLLMPALFNSLLVGWELTVYIGGAFWLNALCVGAGEVAVLLTLGTILFYAVKARGLDRRFFG